MLQIIHSQELLHKYQKLEILVEYIYYHEKIHIIDISIHPLLLQFVYESDVPLLSISEEEIVLVLNKNFLCALQ